MSIDDEHEWSQLYVSQELLDRRLRWLRRHEYTLLPLGEALMRLRANDLPPRAVAITFDDGLHDFSSRAVPVLTAYDAPCAVYLTTYYMVHQWPVFDVMLSYLLWKGAGGRFRWPELHDSYIVAPTRDDVRAREKVAQAVLESGTTRSLSGADKHSRLVALADELGVDFDAICARRQLFIMTPAEVAALDRRLVDVQLHTHRHATGNTDALLRSEIADNRAALQNAAGSEWSTSHFCYPSGFHARWMAESLRSCGVLSATTCEPGLVTTDSDMYFLPRVVDTEALSDGFFGAWASGLAAWPARSQPTP